MNNRHVSFAILAVALLGTHLMHSMEEDIEKDSGIFRKTMLLCSSDFHNKFEQGEIDTLQTDKNKDTLLHYYIKHRAYYRKEDYHDFLPELIHVSKDIDAQNNKGNTPLHLCTKSLYPNGAARLLMEQGANPNIRNHEGKTPLHLALHECKTFFHYCIFVNGLIQKDASLTIADNEGKTPLDLIKDLDDGTRQHIEFKEPKEPNGKAYCVCQ